MTEFGFDAQPRLVAANDHDANMAHSQRAANRPCLVTLESGIQALIEIASLSYVEGVPVAIGRGFTEDVDPADLLERGPDGVRFKLVYAPALAGPTDVDSHGNISFVVPKGD